jgi:folate-dependent tRNA-U54 methylase TrmFO/GidA
MKQVTASEMIKIIREKVVGIRPDDKVTIIGDPVGREALLAELQY